MRGKGGCRDGRRRVEGITPAYAGKSATFSGLANGMGDHPRVCGEKLI